MKSLNKIQWMLLIIIGFAGQLAWMLENMYLNVYLYNELGGSPQDIAWMVALSAITATITTLVMGSISDKVGKRKPFIVVGYLIWGVSVMAFSLINHDVVAKFVPVGRVVGMSVFLLILWDCVMTFLGSSANDAAFNAWVTDITLPQERGKVESVLSILPLMAMLFIFGILDPLTQSGQWSLFFSIIGVLVFITGLISLIFIQDKTIISSQLSLKDTIQYGFKKETILNNKRLYVAFLLLLILGISTQIWMPYLIIYIQKSLLINDYALILGVVLIAASIISVIAGSIIDKVGKLKLFPLGLVIQFIGLIGMYFTKDAILLVVVGTLLMGGNMILTTISNGLIRDYTPESMAGRFQGVRMIFGVMLPMIIGPAIGSFVISSSNETYIELGVEKQVPTALLFIVAALVLLLINIPYKTLTKENPS